MRPWESEVWGGWVPPGGRSEARAEVRLGGRMRPDPSTKVLPVILRAMGVVRGLQEEEILRCVFPEVHLVCAMRGITGRHGYWGRGGGW